MENSNLDIELSKKPKESISEVLEKLMSCHKDENGRYKYPEVDELTQISAKKILFDLEKINFKSFNRMEHTKKVMAGAILYLAYRKTKNPHSLDEISAMSNVDRRDIGRTFNKIKKELGIKYCSPENMSMMSNSCLAITDPKSIIIRYGKLINLPEDIICYAIKICNYYEKNINQRHSPQIEAVSCLYISAQINGINCGKREFADLGGCTEVSVNDTIKIIMEVNGIKRNEQNKYNYKKSIKESIKDYLQCKK